MSAGWAGWAILEALMASAFIFVGTGVVLLGVRGAWRWWQMRDSDRW
jgi:hypothetical protein